jgi:SAM-dependent methyltransferase
MTVNGSDRDRGQPNRYDRIGVGYTTYRQTDPRIAQLIHAALGDAQSIVNVGAGTGSYEPSDRRVVAVEPSLIMLSQRGAHAAPAIRAAAEMLPLADHSFDAAMAMLTIHHWADLWQGLAEFCRVAPRRVIFSFDPAHHDALWVLYEYFPAALGLADEAPLESVAEAIGADRIVTIPIPHDCTDGFASAYWRRPERYLDPMVRQNISCLARLSPREIDDGVTKLEADLETGRWHERHRDLLQLDEMDAGLRLIVADGN